MSKRKDRSRTLGIFDDQLKKRIENDNRAVEDAYLEVNASATGKWERKRTAGRHNGATVAIDKIMEYFKILERGADFDYGDDYVSQLETRVDNSGIFYRNVQLKESWYKKSFEPMITRFKDSGELVALIPKSFSGYYYQQGGMGRKISVNKSNKELFEEEADCFYKPLPMDSITIRDLGRYVFGMLSAADILLVVITLIAAMVLGLVVPMLNRLIFSYILETGNVRMLAGIITFLLCSTVSAAFIRIINSLIDARIGNKVNISVQSAMMMRILSMPADFYREYSTGELSQKLQYVNALCLIMISTIVNEILYFLFSLAFLIQIMAMVPVMALPAVILIILLLLLSIIIISVRTADMEKLTKAESEGYALTYSYLTGIEQITLAGAEKRAFAKWAQKYSKKIVFTYNSNLFTKVYRVIAMGIGLVVSMAFYLIAAGQGVSTADYFAFTTAFGLLCGGVSGLPVISENIAVMRAMAAIIKPFLSTAPEVVNSKQNITELNGSIDMDHVSFKYSEDGPQVIDNLTLSIKAREYVAIVGATGCGKSTLIRLLLGFEDPQKGSIYYDKKPLSTLNKKSVRRRIGAVLQNGKLIQESIYENIVLSHPELTLDDAWEAARIAGLDDVIRKMPMGMHTLISEGSGGISGGQRQRLLIARAVAAKPKILFFDEATSALDNVTQRKVSEAIDNLNCTRVVIAHRLSTIKNCDRIIVIDRGRVAEEGRYGELMEKNGLFKRLVERQQIEQNN